MLDINLLLEDRGGNPEIVKESQRRRGAPVEIVDEIIALYKEWVKSTPHNTALNCTRRFSWRFIFFPSHVAQFQSEQKNKEINAIQKEIGKKFKAKEDASELVAKKAQLQKEKEQLLAQAKEEESIWKEKLSTVGNIVHASVPTSMDEASSLPPPRSAGIFVNLYSAYLQDNNEIIRTYNHNGVEPVKKTDILSHHEVLARLDGYDQDRGANVAGHRGYFLTGVGVDLNLAMINYGLSFLAKRGYKKLMTPFFMKKDVMAKTAQLSQFDEELYKARRHAATIYLSVFTNYPSLSGLRWWWWQVSYCYFWAAYLCLPRQWMVREAFWTASYQVSINDESSTWMNCAHLVFL